jgi:cytidylate kinase
MNNHLIITIGRECGSAGRLIGQKTAAKLGVKCYDKELLTLAAKNSGLCEELFKNHDEKPTNSFLYSLVMDTYSMGGYTASAYMDMPLNHKIFLAQFDTIKKLANEESCVIVGRCADYALADYPNVVSVFIRGDTADKVRHLAAKYNISEDKAKEVMTKTDKRRSSYYNYYSNKRWGSSKSYDLCINSSVVGYDGAVEIILKFAEMKQKYARGQAEKYGAGSGFQPEDKQS